VADYPLWVANYTAAAQPLMPKGWDEWVMWQYIGDWSAPGFNAKIDVNQVNEEWYNELFQNKGCLLKAGNVIADAIRQAIHH